MRNSLMLSRLLNALKIIFKVRKFNRMAKKNLLKRSNKKAAGKKEAKFTR
jgi:hypothetical protein